MVAIVTASHTGFQRISRTTRGCVTPCCGLLVVARSLHLVILFFEECLELSGGVLLLAVGCLLLCDRYVWSYWFSKNDLDFAGMCYSLMWAAGYCATIMSGCTGFRRMPWTLRECVTLCCRLMVIVRPLRLVVLVFDYACCTCILYY